MGNLPCESSEGHYSFLAMRILPPRSNMVKGAPGKISKNEITPVCALPVEILGHTKLGVNCGLSPACTLVSIHGQLPSSISTIWCERSSHPCLKQTCVYEEGCLKAMLGIDVYIIVDRAPESQLEHALIPRPCTGFRSSSLH